MIKTLKLSKYNTKDSEGNSNGFVVPIFNVHDDFFKENDHDPKQFYLTSVNPNKTKGPHKHFIRQCWFCCISGNIKVVIKLDGSYKEFYSGVNHDYQAIIIPRGIPALLINESEDEEALVINMPDPSWAPDMDDEHSEDFSSYFNNE